jgi:hypothetical protein
VPARTVPVRHIGQRPPPRQERPSARRWPLRDGGRSLGASSVLARRREGGRTPNGPPPHSPAWALAHVLTGARRSHWFESGIGPLGQCSMDGRHLPLRARAGLGPGRRAALHGADRAYGCAPRADSSTVRPASPLRPQQRTSGGQRSVWTTVMPNRLAPDSAHFGDQVHDIGIQKSKLPPDATDVFIGRRRRHAVAAGHQHHHGLAVRSVLRRSGVDDPVSIRTADRDLAGLCPLGHRNS